MGEVSDRLVFLNCVTKIVSAYVATNTVSPERLLALIAETRIALSEPDVRKRKAKKAPAVLPEDSITDEYLICLEDGKKVKTLKRYIWRNFGLTPEQYRDRWGLPSGYPMVAPALSRQRSRTAKTIGLGYNRHKWAA